ncbi:MAG: hypothetical protein KIT31_23115 [Deltaproteobacteria bacterium]|nr:hypothetical protein [Deltaproteobacteria bacterium]
MYRIVVAVSLVLLGCAEHGAGGGDGNPDRPPLPAACEGHCISDTPVSSFDDCCDSTTCFFNKDKNEWEVTFCDPPPRDPCLACGPETVCVQQYDGTCGERTFCAPRLAECPGNACSEECQATYCGEGPLQCMTRIPCGTESPGAFTCYGP